MTSLLVQSKTSTLLSAVTLRKVSRHFDSTQRTTSNKESTLTDARGRQRVGIAAVTRGAPAVVPAAEVRPEGGVVGVRRRGGLGGGQVGAPPLRLLLLHAVGRHVADGAVERAHVAAQEGAVPGLRVVVAEVGGEARRVVGFRHRVALREMVGYRQDGKWIADPPVLGVANQDAVGIRTAEGSREENDKRGASRYKTNFTAYVRAYIHVYIPVHT